MPALAAAAAGGGGAPVKPAAFSQYPRAPKDMAAPWAHNSIDHKEADTFLYMGYRCATERVRDGI